MATVFALVALCAPATAGPSPLATHIEAAARSAVAAGASARLGRKRASYGPKQVEIVARDGVKLHTVFTLPGSEDKKYATVIDRSPYGEVGTELIADLFLPFGFAAVGQDFRGTHLSGGEFHLWRSMYNDTYDTVQWILNQPWSNGEIHIVGASADGIAGLVLASHPPMPQIKSQFIVWATGRPHSSVYPGGAYRQGLINGWLNGDIKRPDPKLLEAEVHQHESALDPWWDSVTPRLADVKAPTVFWAGWEDIFLNGNIEAFNGWQNATGGNCWLVVDAMGHCQGAHKSFPGAGIFEGRVSLPIELGFAIAMDTLKPGHAPQGAKKISFFVMGPNRTSVFGGYWTTVDEWPATTPTNYYMHSDGKLRLAPEVDAKAHSFRYDPSDPVPTIGGNNLEIKCGPHDQRPVENRSDVLLFTSDPLDLPMAVVGGLTVTLSVSSANVNDTDWVAKLTDVYPDGTSHLIQDGIVRMRWREKGLNPVPIRPNQVETIEVDLWHAAYVINPGHRIRVAVSSSNYPRFSVNPNTGIPLADPQKHAIVAQNSLHTGGLGENAPRVTLPVVKLDDLPRHAFI